MIKNSHKNFIHTAYVTCAFFFIFTSLPFKHLRNHMSPIHSFIKHTSCRKTDLSKYLPSFFLTAKSINWYFIEDFESDLKVINLFYSDSCAILIMRPSLLLGALFNYVTKKCFWLSKFNYLVTTKVKGYQIGLLSSMAST